MNIIDPIDDTFGYVLMFLLLLKLLLLKLLITPSSQTSV